MEDKLVFVKIPDTNIYAQSDWYEIINDNIDSVVTLAELRDWKVGKYSTEISFIKQNKNSINLSFITSEIGNHKILEDVKLHEWENSVAGHSNKKLLVRKNSKMSEIDKIEITFNRLKEML